MYACIHAPDAGALAQSFSPWVEIVDEKTAVFSLTARQVSEKIYERIPGAQVAVASTAESAILAARNLQALRFSLPEMKRTSSAPCRSTAFRPIPKFSRRWTSGVSILWRSLPACLKKGLPSGWVHAACGCKRWREACSIVRSSQKFQRPRMKSSLSMITLWNCWSRCCSRSAAFCTHLLRAPERPVARRQCVHLDAQPSRADLAPSLSDPRH